MQLPLFFGLVADQALHNRIAQAPPHLAQLFLRDPTGTYLTELVLDEVTYYGKKAGEIITLSELILLEPHLHSLLSRVVGSIDPKHYPCHLIPLPTHVCRD